MLADVELLFVAVIAAGIGSILRYALPRRDAHGILLLPAVATVVTMAVWVALLWLGLTFDGGWIWLISLVAGALATIVVALALPRIRAGADARRLTELSGGRA